MVQYLLVGSAENPEHAFLSFSRSLSGPKWPRDGPKMAPRWPQDGPRGPQDGPKRAQEGPKRPHDGPKMAQNGNPFQVSACLITCECLVSDMMEMEGKCPIHYFPYIALCCNNSSLPDRLYSAWFVSVLVACDAEVAFVHLFSTLATQFAHSAFCKYRQVDEAIAGFGNAPFPL